MKYVLAFVVAFIVSFFVVTAVADAGTNMTIQNAGRAAAKYQAQVCGSGFGWSCNNSIYQWPDCLNTGVNRRGATQWDCTGEVYQERYDLLTAYCYVYSHWDPYGKQLYGNKICTYSG